MAWLGMAWLEYTTVYTRGAQLFHRDLALRLGHGQGVSTHAILASECLVCMRATTHLAEMRVCVRERKRGGGGGADNGGGSK